MRIKKDILLKSYLLANTMHLTSEEYGTIIRCAQIEDDKTESRYENLSGMILELYKEKEEQWKKDLERMMALNPAIIPAYSLIYGQASNSRKAFDKMQRYYDNKDGTAEEEQPKKKETKKKENAVVTAQETPQSEIPDKWKSLYRTEKFGTGHSVRDLMFLDGEVIKAHFEIANAKNIISQAEFIKLEKEMGDIELIKDMIARANKEGWKEHWETYL